VSPAPLPIAPGDALAPLRLPVPERVFRDRATRLDALAPDHPAGDWLRFLARLVRGQDRAVRELRAPAPLRAGGGPPLAGALAASARSWRAALEVVLTAARDGPLPGPARAAVERLEAAPPDALEALAAQVPGGAPEDLAAAPFVGAALQVHLARLAARVDPGAVSPGAGSCPVCGGLPAASVVLGDARARYLSCGLCGAEWNLPRVQCPVCRDASRLSYLAVEDGRPGVAAETCDRCRAYLKIFDLAEAPGADAIADDAATLVLDVLLGERGFLRAGVNPLAPGGERAWTA
jgi:FdhE protein